MSRELNRIFILGGKGLTEDEFHTAFEKYGRIENIWITKDRKTGQDKGITYITYEKTSEACLAVQEMNQKCILNTERPLKVILASDKRDGSRRSADEDQLLMRLFVVVPKGQDEIDIRKHFEHFGEVADVHVLRDRRSGQPKGLAYVKFYRQYDAAKAMEECDTAYKAIFAESKPSRDDDYGGHSSYSNTEYRGRGSYSSSSASMAPLMNSSAQPPHDLLQDYTHTNQCVLEALVPEVLGQQHVHALFDLVPGMRSCVLDRRTASAIIEYSTPQSAAYAKNKVDGMEYPLGYWIAVRFVPTGPKNPLTISPALVDSSFNSTASALNQSMANVAAGGTGISQNIQSLVQSIQKATEVLQSAGVTSPNMTPAWENVHYCNVTLPARKPYASRDSPLAERLFIVSSPNRFDESVLEDTMCRFGNFISAYFMPGKTFGYAKFAKKESAEEAVKVLHGQQILGNKVKVMISDPPKFDRQEDHGPERKRRRSP